MNTLIYIHPDDTRIDRGQDSEYAMVTGKAGKPIYNFPATWTDEQIKLALAVANLFYAQGVQDGKCDLIADVQRVLDSAI